MRDAANEGILIKRRAAGQCQNAPAVGFDGDGRADHTIQKRFGAALQSPIYG